MICHDFPFNIRNVVNARLSGGQRPIRNTVADEQLVAA
jgi:hypothetical protein